MTAIGKTLGHFQIFVLSGVFPSLVKRSGKWSRVESQLLSKSIITTNTLLSWDGWKLSLHPRGTGGACSHHVPQRNEK